MNTERNRAAEHVSSLARECCSTHMSEEIDAYLSLRFLLMLINYDRIIITCEICIGVIATIYHRGFAPYYTGARRSEKL